MKVKHKHIVTLKDQLNNLLENNQEAELRVFLNDQYPQDLAETLENLNEEEQVKCFKLLELEGASKVLAELNHEAQMNLLKALGPKHTAPIISLMDVDDATDIIIQLPDEEKTALLRELPDPIQQAHVQELIHYPSESAGGIMSTDF